MSRPLLVRQEGSLLHLTLNAPQRGNALSAELVEELLASLGEPGIGAPGLGARGAETRLVALAGAGRHFCTGFDLSGYEDQSEGDLALRLIRIEQMLQAVEASPVPTLAIAQGRAFGAGADLFVACDHRLCTPDASFCFPGSGFGVVLGSRRLALRVGQDRARDILMARRVIDAQEALRIGLATQIVAPEALPEAVSDAARSAPDLTLETMAALRSATSTARPDADLAHLVRSVAAPGLKDRLRRYIQSVQAKKS